MEPKLALTVERSTWDEVSGACGVAFADSYLSGAVQTGSRVTPHSRIAHDRIAKRGDAMRALNGLGLELVRPLPFGHHDRPDARGGPLFAPAPATYEELSITEKIRHHQILANQAEIEAGPMWSGGMGPDGGPLRADQMGEKWREGREKARFHYGKVRELRDARVDHRAPT